MRGGFEPGQKLKSLNWRRLGTSAMPVREALMPYAERAIESMRTAVCGAVIIERIAAGLMEALVQSKDCGRASAANMDTETLSTLRDSLSPEATDAETRVRASAEQNRLSTSHYRRSGSAVLLPIIESLWLQFGPYLRVASERFDGREGRGTNFHVEMLRLWRWAMERLRAMRWSPTSADPLIS